MSDAGGSGTPPSATPAEQAASTTQPLLWFVITTSIFFILRYATSTKEQSAASRSSSQKMWTGVYLLILIVGEYFINLRATKALCGSAQWSTTFYMTFGPWVLIFGVMNLLLLAFPGWVAPFSNTVGYGFAKLAGISSLMGKIFRFHKAGTQDTAETSASAEILGRVYADKSLLINEITPESVNDFWSNMWPLFRAEVKGMSKPANDPDGTNPLKTKLRSLVILKDTVGLFCWYMLAGMLVTGVSYNYVMGSACTKTKAQIEAAHKEFAAEQEKIRMETAKNPPKVYTITGA